MTSHTPFIYNDLDGNSLTFHGGAADDDGQPTVAVEAEQIGRGTAWVHVRHTDAARVADELRIAAGLPSADRAAVLREAADAVENLIADGEHDPDCLVDELRRLADETPAATDEAHLPRRGDQFEQWLKARRDAYGYQGPTWVDLDNILDRYRLHADTGTPLDEHVREGRTVGDCECFERQQDEAET